MADKIAVSIDSRCIAIPGDSRLLELFNVRHQCIALDLRIFARTLSAMRKGL